MTSLMALKQQRPLHYSVYHFCLDWGPAGGGANGKVYQLSGDLNAPLLYHNF